MPCFTRTETDVEVGKMSPTHLTTALTELKLRPLHTRAMIIDFDNGEYNHMTGNLTLRGGNVENRTAKIKQHYSMAVVKDQARRFGWTVKSTGDNKLQILKG